MNVSNTVDECYSQHNGRSEAGVGNAVIVKASCEIPEAQRTRALLVWPWQNEAHGARERQGSKDRNTVSSEREGAYR